ncbi:putative bifunctional diguanylate cyclase/phosphodiesterase [Nucisporomicrobium flavum]|uniref:putative bifunctional diguanylate cyclase/phosphodiesterase n=1 Tax=Nucisporomicrobium flavum TaxID=2785915 RepID=UPI003C2D89D5
MNDARTDKRLELYVGLVAFLGVGCLLASAATATIVSPGKLLFLAATTIIIAFASGPIIKLRVRSDTRVFAATSASILLAVATVPAPWVVICTALGVLASKIFIRQPIKIAFNVAKDIIAATAAASIASFVGIRPTVDPQIHLPSPPVLVLGLAAAAVVYAIVDDLLGNTVVALATNTPWRQVARQNRDVMLRSRAVNLVLALLTVLVVQQQQLLILTMVPTVAAFQLVAKNKTRQREDQEAWHRLASTTDRLNVTELTSVLHAAVTLAPDLFSADEAEIELRDLDTPSLIRGSAGSLRYEGALADAPEREGSTIEAWLDSPDGRMGVLRLRFRKPVKLNESEQYKLQTFASSLSTAIGNARAYAELKRINAENAYAASHDPLTGLANRRELLDQATRTFGRRAADGMFAMLLIDLNHFKEVNDTLGHTAGDEVLREVAHRIETAAYPGDLVARLGGDEFAVLLTGLPTPAVATHRATDLLATLEQPIEVDGMQLTVEAAGGIALAPGSGGVQELMRRADVAMYEAKRGGRRTATYAHARDTADIGRLVLGGELTRAVTRREFVVDFQPIADLSSGEVVSAEAIARWHHPQHTDLTPLQFLESVERSGHLPAFADAVLEKSLTAVGTWREAGFDLSVAVNVSPRSLLDPTFPAGVLDRLAALGVPPDRLVLELAESLTLSQLEVVDRALRELRDAGVKLVLDDFGTGVSSLPVLSRIPVHQLKIDRDLVVAVETSAEAAAVIRSTVDLARSLHLSVIAEGVESEPQRHALWEIGCVAGQGHLFARPMAAARFLAALQRGSGGRPGALAEPLHTTGSVVRMPRRRPPRRSLPHLPA